jgi:phage tail sheath protein FI
MPEYLAPGVYVEETTFRQKSIEGVSTSTAGFVGPTRFGPTSGEPELLTSFLDFERIYGGIDQLDYGDMRQHNDLAHAVRGFFENGGRRLYVARTFNHSAEPGEGDLEDRYPDFGLCVLSGTVSDPGVWLRARWPGAAGNFIVTFDVKVGPNILVGNGSDATLSGALRWDTVLVDAPGASPLHAPTLQVVNRVFDDVSQEERLVLLSDGDETTVPQLVASGATDVRVITLTVTLSPLGRFMDTQVWENINPDPRHATNSLGRKFAAEPPDRATLLYVPLIIGVGDLTDGAAILEELLASLLTMSPPVADTVAEAIEQAAITAPATAPPARVRCRLDGGSDGNRPDISAYEGDESSTGDKSGLLAFEDLEDISIVAAPGASRGGLNGYAAESESIAQLLISHAERMWYRIAVLDAPDAALVSDVRGYRAQFDSKHAAFYYPWIKILDPITGTEITTPPSGFMAGIYARNDIERGVHKAPANEVVRLAIDFELPINKGQQDVLNPEGVNCLRYFEGRGYRVWGARTISSDPEWKYLNLRRYFAFIERSIEKGTQWAVFEPNGTALWGNVRRTIEDFLFNEFKSGHLLGDTVDEAYFVKCDRTTMTQNDLDNGRLICLIGIAPLRPAEYVIFRIGQKTLDFKG